DLFEKGLLMTSGIVGNTGDALEAKLLIEARGLEAVGGQQQLDTTAPGRFRFRGLHQPPSESLPALRFRHPELLDFATGPPRVPIDARHNLVVLIPDERGQARPISDSCCLTVEL